MSLREVNLVDIIIIIIDVGHLLVNFSCLVLIFNCNGVFCFKTWERFLSVLQVLEISFLEVFYKEI